MLGCKVSSEIDIFGNEYDIIEGGTAAGNTFRLPSVTESASNAFVSLCFTIFYSIDGKTPLIVRKWES